MVKVGKTFNNTFIKIKIYNIFILVTLFVSISRNIKHWFQILSLYYFYTLRNYCKCSIFIYFSDFRFGIIYILITFALAYRLRD